VAELYGDPNQGMGLAARVILHLSQLGRLGANDVATIEYTQQGMVGVFAVRQGSLVKVLLRLIAGDAVAVERRYVAGVNQRLKVYRLTALGESVARDLRHRKARPGPSQPAGEWIAPRAAPDRSPPDRERFGA
jgi:DNA-binding PadR family transcriptional regulator